MASGEMAAPASSSFSPPALDYTQILKGFADIHFPDAARIILVQDNLSTHTSASFYTAFPPAEASPRRALRAALHAQARQLAEHGAECEFAVLTRQYLDRRIQDKATLIEQAAA